MEFPRSKTSFFLVSVFLDPTEIGNFTPPFFRVFFPVFTGANALITYQWNGHRNYRNLNITENLLNYSDTVEVVRVTMAIEQATL